MSPSAIFRRARSAVVVVRTADALGSGFVVNAAGVVVTNLHVAAGRRAIKVLLANGNEARVFRIEALDDEHDLVALRIKRRAPSLALATSDRLGPGQPVVAIGSPMGLEATISEGIVSGLRAFEDGTRVVQITAPISPGSSGEPILNTYGEVIAVATFGIVGGNSLGFGMPVSYVHELLAKPRRMKLADFAKLTADTRAPPEEEVEQHDLALLDGCTKSDIGLLERLLGKALDLGDRLRRAKEHASAVQVFEGAALDAGRKLPKRCAGPKRELAAARHSIESVADDEQKATLLRGAFRALTDVSRRWRESHASGK